MSLLGNNILPPNPQAPNKEVLLKQAVSRIKNLSKECFNNLVRTQREGIKIVWENEHLTPQEIIDEMGTDVFKIFQFHGGLTQFIQTLAQNDGATVEVKYPTHSFTANLSAGTITVHDTPYQP
jgi:hypothetical protein